jgi:hypothetical protein
MTAVDTRNMRQLWFDHVAKVRTKLSRGKKDKATHREAMVAASVTWPKEKEKITKKRDRASRLAAKQAKKIATEEAVKPPKAPRKRPRKEP